MLKIQFYEQNGRRVVALAVAGGEWSTVYWDNLPRWIPVTERLPEEDYETGNGVQFSADVLATIVNHKNDGELFVWLLKTVDGKWYDYTPNEDGTHEIPYWCEVIAWMPLPEPYKGGEEE